ncbi:protein of unknown function [Paenibacillus alvei]|uniref:Uncharacterized protein n=1 Tax=Paenibacillus alvei TaxID=44250 RepID=A0A383RFV8_PAEAL|nr:protein of unknown function [Paenibacillus alvei]
MTGPAPYADAGTDHNVTKSNKDVVKVLINLTTPFILNPSYLTIFSCEYTLLQL